jgi:glutamate/aspartate transport system permease protein
MGQYNWDWEILVQSPYLGWLIAGAELTIALSLCMWLVGFIIGTAVGVGATSTNPVIRVAAKCYVGVVRNIPPVVQLFVWFFVVPELLPASWGVFLKRDLPYSPFWTSMVGLGLFLAARVAEHVRAGLEAIPKTLVHASLATGLSPGQAYRYIRLPIAYRTVLPTLTSEFLVCIKMSSIAMTIGVTEITAQSYQVESYTYHGIEAFSATTVFYLCFSAVIVAGSSLLEKAYGLGK